MLDATGDALPVDPTERRNSSVVTFRYPCAWRAEGENGRTVPSSQARKENHSTMSRALIVGIDKYDNIPPLTGCANDARSMKDILEHHEDGSDNFSCHMFVSPGNNQISRKFLRKQWSTLFDNYEGDILFYFSGHGHPTDAGGYIVTQDAEEGDPGLNMDELLALANRSKATSVLLILDCCFAGSLGDPALFQGRSADNLALLRSGLTIIAASRPLQTAAEDAGRGVFTSLIVEALSGGAADVRGRVSAASMYAFVEQALGPWEQRAVYKSHAYRLSPLRQCKPAVSDLVLKWLLTIFPKVDDCFRLDPSYEHTHKTKRTENVEVFDKLKVLRNARLLTTEGDLDLYYIALKSKTVNLTPLGKFYWRLAASKNLR
jgi:hypothetical protein